MGAGPVPPQFPPLLPVEVGDEGEEALGGGVDLSRQDHDLLLQLLQGIDVVAEMGWGIHVVAGMGEVRIRPVAIVRPGLPDQMKGLGLGAIATAVVCQRRLPEEQARAGGQRRAWPARIDG
jgi:hypothetical protein